jgi:hypothetical protein
VDLGPIILGGMILIFSICSSIKILTDQSKFFEVLSNQTTKFDCVDFENRWFNDIAPAQIQFRGKILPCLIPNLYKSDVDDFGSVDRIFENILSHCRETSCL